MDQSKYHCLPIMCSHYLFFYFSVYSIYTSHFTRVQSRNLHSTNSDEHSLTSLGTDDCPVCMCEKVCKENKGFWLYKVSVKGVLTSSNLKENDHYIKFTDYLNSFKKHVMAYYISVTFNTCLSPKYSLYK
jgi:hypothetical protein